MGSGIEERIRELLASTIGESSPVEPRRVEMAGVTIIEVKVERLVVVLDQSESQA